MSREVFELLVYGNPVLRNYAFWSCILIIKMLLMTTLTAAQRIRNKDDAPLPKRFFVTQVLVGALKTYIPQAFVAIYILKKLKAFSNPEDLKVNRVLEVKFDDPHVERVRRAHRNDLEAIVPYLIVSFIYVLTDPVPAVALNLFRVSVGCRIVHTLVYAVYVLPQPARAIAFFVPHFITWYMAVQSAIVFVN